MVQAIDDSLHMSVGDIDVFIVVGIYHWCPVLTQQTLA